MEATTSTKMARLVKRGDIVRLPTGEGEIEEVVRDVSMIFHLANGSDMRLDAAQDVTIVHDPEIVVPEDPSISKPADARLPRPGPAS